MFDIVLDTLMLPIEREVAADIRKRLSSLSWRPNQIAVGSVLAFLVRVNETVVTS